MLRRGSFVGNIGDVAQYIKQGRQQRLLCVHLYHRAYPGESSGANSVAIRRRHLNVGSVECLGLITQSSVLSDRVGRDLLEIFLRQVLGQANNWSQQ